MTNKSTHWHVLYEGECYANDLRFNEPLNEAEVRAYLREYHDVNRLFANTQLWME